MAARGGVAKGEGARGGGGCTGRHRGPTKNKFNLGLCCIKNTVVAHLTQKQ